MAEQDTSKHTGRDGFTANGDPVCWLENVCDECGALVEAALPATCWRCGAVVRAE